MGAEYSIPACLKNNKSFVFAPILNPCVRDTGTALSEVNPDLAV